MSEATELYRVEIKNYPEKIREDIFRIKHIWKYFFKKDVQVHLVSPIAFSDTDTSIFEGDVNGGHELVYVGQFYPSIMDEAILGAGKVQLTSIYLDNIDFTVPKAPIDVICIYRWELQGFINGNVYKVVEL